jgi:hypothetical protein
MFSPSKILRNTLKTHRKLSRASQILPPKTRNFWHRSNLCKDGEKSMEKEKSKDAKVKEETEFERALREAREEAESEPVKSETAVKKFTIWEKIKHEASHYWHGSKLLAAETSISSRLLLKTLKGKPLTRREYRQVSKECSLSSHCVPFYITNRFDLLVKTHNWRLTESRTAFDYFSSSILGISSSNPVEIVSHNVAKYI